MPFDGDENVRIVWAPQAGPQKALIDCPFTEIFWGGSRGGGKTDGILGKWAIKSWRYGSDFNGVFFRKEMPQTDDLIERAKEIYIPLGADWREQPRAFRMPGGGRIRFRPLETVADAEKYQGQNFTDAAVEEAGNYPDPKPIDMLFGALRSKAGVPVQLILTANPGGVGQQWIKYRYVDPSPRGRVPLVRVLPNGAEHRYIYIPSRVQDNRILLDKDPSYINRLYLVGSKELVRAWLEGDWSVVAGAFFPEFSMDKHVVAPRSLPAYWQRFRSFDWGSARPFAVHWWAVSDGELAEFPRGALICYREWYGAQTDEVGNTIPNSGLRLTAEEVADGILKREEKDVTGKRTMGGVADPAIFAENGGPSIGDRMASRKVFFRPGDNKRVAHAGAIGGWDQLRARLKGDGEQPAIYFFATAREVIRTLPALQYDRSNAEDCDCWVAGTMVATPSGEVPIEKILPGDLVDTPCGARPVLRSYLSGASGTVWVKMSDGRELRGTPHHKIAIKRRGLVALEDLSCYEIPQERIIWSRSLNIAVSLIVAMRGVCTTIRLALFSPMEQVQAFIARCGLIPEQKFRPVGMCTTEMMTTTITASTISNVCRQESTSASTIINASRVTLDRRSRHGVSQMMDAQSFEGMRKRCTNAHLNGNSRALIVRLLLLRDILINVFAPMNAVNNSTVRLSWFVRFAALVSRRNETQKNKRKHALIVAVGRSEERVPVYNLTVADTHLFYANGVLSSNTDGEDHCADSVRYSAMSRPYTAPLPFDADAPEPDRYARHWKPTRRVKGSAMSA